MGIYIYIYYIINKLYLPINTLSTQIKKQHYQHPRSLIKPPSGVTTVPTPRSLRK